VAPQLLELLDRSEHKSTYVLTRALEGAGHRTARVGLLALAGRGLAHRRYHRAPLTSREPWELTGYKEVECWILSERGEAFRAQLRLEQTNQDLESTMGSLRREAANA
jgi:hypothetical protein